MPRQLQEAVVVAVAGVIPLVAAVRLRCVLCALCGEVRIFTGELRRAPYLMSFQTGWNSVAFSVGSSTERM
jgi:hypothetical protein